jgi:hypothetical protein
MKGKGTFEMKGVSLATSVADGKIFVHASQSFVAQIRDERQRKATNDTARQSRNQT